MHTNKKHKGKMLLQSQAHVRQIKPSSATWIPRCGGLAGWASLLACCLSLAAYSPLSSAGGAALDMVKQLKLGQWLGPMSLQVAKRTQTYPMITTNLGEARANALVTDELKAAVPQYQGQWDSNLAGCYAEKLGESDMLSMIDQKQASPSFRKFQDAQPAVAKCMESRSRELLVKLVTEALGNAVAKSQSRMP